MSKLSTRLAILAVFLHGVTLLAAPATAPSAFVPPWGPDVFPISLWCGPPAKFVTVERFRQLADAGFTVAMPSCDGASPETNRKILDAARAVGIKSFVMDGRIPYAIGGSQALKKGLDGVVADYAAHPALAGYFLADEPGPEAYAGLAEVADYLRKKDPAHPAYVNLLPNFVNPHAIGGSYEKYVDAFATTVHPFAICYDHYFMMKSGDRPGFFENLATVRSVALKHGVPFWNIVLSTAHNVYRPLTEAEKRFEAMQTLAYGGGGLMWFTYWQPTVAGDWGDAIINADGKPTSQYAEITRVNKEVQAVGRVLMHCRSTDVYTGDATGKPASVGDKSVTVGVFDRGTEDYLLLANRNYKSAGRAALRFRDGAGRVERLDLRTGEWQEMPLQAVGTYDIELSSGGAALIRWAKVR